MKLQHKRSESLQLDGFNAFESPNKHSLIKSIISSHVTPTNFQKSNNVGFTTGGFGIKM